MSAEADRRLSLRAASAFTRKAGLNDDATEEILAAAEDLAQTDQMSGRTALAIVSGLTRKPYGSRP
jgi:hypothetical protein